MFEFVVILICLGSPQAQISCLKLQDQWGPYETEAACKQRVSDIVTAFSRENIQLVAKFGFVYKYKCAKKKPKHQEA